MDVRKVSGSLPPAAAAAAAASAAHDTTGDWERRKLLWLNRCCARIGSGPFSNSLIVAVFLAEDTCMVILNVGVRGGGAGGG